MQNLTNVTWDPTLTQLEIVPSNAFTRQLGIANLFYRAVKMTSGAPANTAGRFIPGAIVQNAITGVLYYNSGTTASPNFIVIGSGGSGITQLTGDVLAGPGVGSQPATIANGAVTAAKLGATFPFAGTPTTISPTAALDAAPTFSGTPATLTSTGTIAVAAGTVADAIGFDSGGNLVSTSGGTIAVSVSVSYTPAGTNDAPTITVTGVSYTPAGTITPA